MSRMKYRNTGKPGSADAPHLSTDTGGTFTDFVFLTEKGIEAFKVLSTPDNPAEAVLNGLSRFKNSGLTSFSHGTTVATNAVLEGKGDRTALVTTRGFRDVIFIGRQQRAHLYSFRNMRPSALISREDVFELNERVGPEGQVITPLSIKEVEAQGRTILERGYTSVGVVLLFSFLHPEHERMTGKILSGLGLGVSLSSDVLPEYREYERTSTTLMDAYVRGKLGNYLLNLKNEIQGFGLKNFYIMESEGGVAPSEELQKIPSKGLLSGPAGGVSGALYLGRISGRGNIITLDMGGTSTDISRITDLRPEYTSDYRIRGLPFSRRSLNIVSIGAGGGSIVKRDSGGAIMVGPESAGASPGPVCYGFEGKEPTLTDINLLAGYLNPVDFLGKGKHLRVAEAEKAVRRLSERLNYTPEQTIEGVLRVVGNNMASALRMVTTEAGKNPADYTLLSFGGAGPVHGAALARELGINEVIVPFAAGMFSAFGILLSDVVFTYSVTRAMPLNTGETRRGEEIISDFLSKGRTALTDEGIPDENQTFYPTADLRFRGQSYHLNVPFSPDEEALKERFEREYTDRYGYLPEGEVEFVNLRLEARGKREVPPLPVISEERVMGSDDRVERRNEPCTHRNCLFGEYIETPVFRRNDLGMGFQLQGPAIIEDRGSTTVVPPGAEFSVDEYGNILIRV